MAVYLDAWLMELPDDIVGIARALGDIVRAKGMSQVAKGAGLSRESLYKALSEMATPASQPSSKLPKHWAFGCAEAKLELVVIPSPPNPSLQRTRILRAAEFTR